MYPSQNETYLICEVNNHKQVEVNENIDVNVNSNSNDTMLQDTYNDGASMSTSTELFNDTVSYSAQVLNFYVKTRIVIKKEQMCTFSGSFGKPLLIWR